MPSQAVQTNDAPEQRSQTPCRICEMQLCIQWLYTAHSLLNIWIFRFGRPRLRNKAFWCIVSVAAVIGLRGLSEEPYYCGAWRQKVVGPHFWGRAAAGVVDIVEFANDGARRLAAWFRERCTSSQLSDGAQEPEMDDDYDFCGLE